MRTFKKDGENPISYGKTKKIWAVEGDGNLVIMESLNDTTADNDPDKTRIMQEKGKCSTSTTSRMFELLTQAGIPNSYIEQLSETEILAKKCTMIPLEVIIRRYATGSYLERMPQFTKAEGDPDRFHKLRFEVFLKTSKGKLGDLDIRNYFPKDKEELIKYLNVEKTIKNLKEKNIEVSKLIDLDYDTLVEEAVKLIDDPWIENPENIIAWSLRHPKKPIWEVPALTIMDGSSIIDADKLQKIEELTRKTFLLLEGAWNTLGYRLIDFKIEFGIDTEGNLVVADVIDNDSWRLRTDEWKELSKQTFREGHPLAEVQANYLRVASLVEQFRIPKQAIVIWRGSDKDELPDFKALPGVTVENIIISGHKEPVKASEKLNELQAKYPEGAVIIAVVGMSNGLGPTISARTPWMVLSYCNSAKTNPEDVWSNLRMPSDVPNATFLKDSNAYLAALNILSIKNPVAYMTREYAIEKYDK